MAKTQEINGKFCELGLEYS